MNITVIGGGNIGTQFAVHSSDKGHSVKMFTSNPSRFSKHLFIVDKSDNVIKEGEIVLATSDPHEALHDAEMIMITMPPTMMIPLAQIINEYAVILLGFGLNLGVVLETGKQSLPIICSTITISLVMAWILRKVLRVPGKIATLIGVGSSICGGSAVAATAPVIDADDEEVAQAISVIFLFNVLAALIFPALGGLIGFDTTSGESFGIFAGTAVNDTSSVTATASTWDSLYGLGSQTLDKAVTVKLTRTLAIIPITLVLALARAKREKAASNAFSFRRAFPMFILWFIVASLITTICTTLGVSASVFAPLKTLSKFFIVMAMTAIGLNTDIVRLVKNGGKPIALGFGCWAAITVVSLLMQYAMGIM